MILKNLQKNILFISAIFGTLIISYQYFHVIQKKYLNVTSFTACVDAGFKVIPTYPEKCSMPGKIFVNQNQKKIEVPPHSQNIEKLVDYKNQTYLLNGQQVHFINGHTVTPPDQLLHQATTSFTILDQPFLYDINGDTLEDTLFLIYAREDSTGKNSYYVGSLVSLNQGFYGTNLLYIDTSILSSLFVYKNDHVILEYTQQGNKTIQKQKYFVFENNILKEIIHK